MSSFIQIVPNLCSNEGIRIKCVDSWTQAEKDNQGSFVLPTEHRKGVVKEMRFILPNVRRLQDLKKYGAYEFKLQNKYFT